MIRGSLTRCALCIMLSEREIVWEWHLIKESFRSIFRFDFWSWRLSMQGGERFGRRWAFARLLTKLVSCQSKQAAPSPSRSFSTYFQLICWNLNFFLFFHHVNGKPISRPDFKSMYCSRLQYQLPYFPDYESHFFFIVGLVPRLIYQKTYN